MNEALPKIKDLEKTEKNLKKFGTIKLLWLQILTYWPLILFVIVSSVAISVVFSVKITNKNIIQFKSNFENEIKQIININLNEKDTSIQKVNLEKNEYVSKNLKSFDPINWTFFQTNPKISDEGFYCPKNVAFPSWFVWTPNKFLIGEDIKVIFKLKDKTNNDKPPTLLLSYGDKTGNKPDIFYRINVLDGDLKTIRVYDKDQKEIESDRSENVPNLNDELTLVIKSFFPKSNLVKLTLTPELSFKLESNKEYTFIPDKEFSFGVSLANTDQQGEGKQIGIGVSKGDCFKILSSNLEK